MNKIFLFSICFALEAHSVHQDALPNDLQAKAQEVEEKASQAKNFNTAEDYRISASAYLEAAAAYRLAQKMQGTSAETNSLKIVEKAVKKAQGAEARAERSSSK